MKVLTKQQGARLRVLEPAIRKLAAIKTRSRAQERALCDGYREAIRLYQDVVSADVDIDENVECRRLLRLATQGMLHLGGEGDVRRASLKDYDHKRYGPYLGVSDEGSAAGAIRKAARDSPKAVALRQRDPMVLGVALDAERLGGIGEVAVGPQEYVNIRLACVGRILNSTNIGTRVNLRFYRRHPVVSVARGDLAKALRQAKQGIRDIFKPFLRPPGGKPRPLAIYIEIEDSRRRSAEACISILKSLNRFAKRPDVADPAVHRLGYQVRIGWGKNGRDSAMAAIDTASAAGIRDVAISGVVRKQADENLSQPGLLNYLTPGLLGPVLRHAGQRKVQIRPTNTVDPDTVANHVWSALHTARQMGLELGKYGLFPLTLEESDIVIGKIQAWYRDWTAAPVFFVDQGLLSATRVDTHGDLIRGLTAWLNLVARHKVPVVLIDTFEKAKSQPLLRLPGETKGLLTARELQRIDRLAERLKIKALWAGGITLPQVYELGRLGIFGIYVTSSAASPAPVSPDYAKDPWLAAVKEPTYEGVYRTKLLLEAGFLKERVNDRKLSADLGKGALEFIRAMQAGDKPLAAGKEKSLAALTVDGWRAYGRH